MEGFREYSVVLPLVSAVVLHNQEGVSIRTETVALLEGDAVGVHDLLISSEGGYGHQHSGLRQVEIGDRRVRDDVFIRREDELVGPAVEGIDLPVGGDIGLDSAHDGNADCEYLVAGAVGAVDIGCGLLGNNQPFGVHPVLREVLDVDAAEVADTHVDGDEGLVNVLENHPVEQFTAEVESGRGSGDGAFVGGEDCLEVFGVLRGDLLFDPDGDRGLSEGEKGLLEFLVRSVEEEAEGASAGCCIVDHFGDQGIVLAEVQLVADTDFAGGLDYYVPEALFAVQLPKEEDHDVGAGLFLPSVEPGGEDLGIVEDEEVVLGEIVDDVLEYAVFDFTGLLVEDHHPALVPPADRFLRDPFLGEFEVELGKLHVLLFEVVILLNYGAFPEKVSYPGLFEDLDYGREGIFQEGGQGGTGDPCGLGDVLFPLRGQVGRVGVEHVVPPSMFEMPHPVPEVAVVGYADKASQLEFVDSGLLPDFPKGGHLDVLARLLMAFRQVPEPVSGNHEEVSPPV